MDLTWSDAEHALQAEAAAVAAAGVKRFGAHTDAWMNGDCREFSRELGRRGWIGMTWPAEYGGGGRSPLHRMIIGEEMIKAGAPIARSWFADRQVGPTLIAHGTPEQRAEYLPDILSGNSTWCIGMSEPEAGSDLAGLRTTARRNGDEWVINGHKIWTSFALVADYCYLICRTDSDAPRHEGISEIIVPMSAAGITVRPIRDLTGATHFCEVFLDDVHLPVDNLVGAAGKAFSQTMRQLEHERGGIDRLVSNFMLYRLALEHADLDDPGVRQQVAEIETHYRVGRLMVIREALRQGPPGYSAVTKSFCTAHEQRVAQFTWRVLGDRGLLADATTLGLLYSTSYTIMGGTSQVLANIIGERMLGLPREPGSNHR